MPSQENSPQNPALSPKAGKNTHNVYVQSLNRRYRGRFPCQLLASEALGYVKTINCFAESVQNQNPTPSTHYFGRKCFTKWKTNLIKPFLTKIICWGGWILILNTFCTLKHPTEAGFKEGQSKHPAKYCCQKRFPSDHGYNLMNGEIRYGWGNLDMPIYVPKISFFVKTLSL